MSKQSKEVLFDDKLHAKINSGLEQAYRVAKASYGPNAGNAILEFPYGDPIVSRDGVTNLKKLKLPDAAENAAVRIVVQASSHNNETVGDGTTASVILAYHLYQAGRKLIAAGNNQMVVSRQITEVSQEAIKQIDKLKEPLTNHILKHVAVTSSGDEALGDMIADTIGTIGSDGGVTIEDYMGKGIYNEIVDGFYFRKGLISSYLAKDPSNMESRHTNTPILIFDKQIMTQNDIAEILDRIMDTSKELIIVGSVGGDALALIVELRLQNKLLVSVVDAPYEARALFLEDLAILTGGKVISEGFNPVEFNTDMLGFASKVVITTQSTTIIGSDGASEDVKKRISELQDQLKTATHPSDIEIIKSRLARLTGKVAIIRVGGATEAEQGEVKLRVQDAVCATQAALKDGIVPGGGVALARLKLDKFEDAFKQPFKQLVENSGLNPDTYLSQLGGSLWEGFNFRESEPHLEDMKKLGVIDPALVIKEVVANAASVAAKLLTTSSGIFLSNREEKLD